jgi:hypothetical protein
MANAIVYVDSGAGGANNGTSWANAYTTLEAAVTASGTTGTDFYVKSTHTEGKGSALTLTFKGVAATPDRVFSSGTTNSPPTTGDLTFGALINCTVGQLGISGCVYIYGCQLQAAANSWPISWPASGAASVNNDVVYDNCKLVKTGTAATMLVGPVGGSNLTVRVTWINTTIKCSNASDKIQVRGGIFRWLSTTNAIDATGTLPTTLFTSGSTTTMPIVICDGVDFSALTSKALTDTMSNSNGPYQFIDCKFPSGMTIGVPATIGYSLDFINCDSGSATYKQERRSYQGTLTADTGVYNGATDGVTPISWQVITSATANPQSPFECFDIVQWAAAGAYNASKIYFTCATANLKTNDVWVDVEYLGASYPLGAPATTLGAGSGSTTKPQQPQGDTLTNITSGVSWATGGLGNNYSLDIPPFTTSAAGYVRFRVKVGKLSLTLNIDPLAVVV